MIACQLFMSDHESLLGVLVVAQEQDALLQECLALWVARGCLFFREDRAQHLCELGHAVGQSHQAKFVQFLQWTKVKF